ncbi:MAG: hypothetical protein ACE5K8_10375 [Candidatus Zixiibacteriota bacterium]
MITFVSDSSPQGPGIGTRQNPLAVAVSDRNNQPRYSGYNQIILKWSILFEMYKIAGYINTSDPIISEKLKLEELLLNLTPIKS